MKWSENGNNDHILMTLPPPEFPADPTKPSEQDPSEDVQESRETRRRGSCRFLSPPNSCAFSPLLVTVTIKVLEEDIAVAEEDIDIVGVEKKEAAEEERRMKAAVAKVELSG